MTRAVTKTRLRQLARRHLRGDAEASAWLVETLRDPFGFGRVMSILDATPEMAVAARDAVDTEDDARVAELAARAIAQHEWATRKGGTSVSPWTGVRGPRKRVRDCTEGSET